MVLPRCCLPWGSRTSPTPLAFVTAVFTPPAKVAACSASRSCGDVTVTPATGFELASFTVACSADANDRVEQWWLRAGASGGGY